LALALAMSATALFLRPAIPVVQACGGFFRAPQVPPEKRPTLAREKVLLIHDAAKGRQHFIREVAFRKANDSFGFVVPTPTRPEVASIAQTPFTKLRQTFAYDGWENAYGVGGLGLVGRGGGGAPRGVEVLEEKKVGSFTAFVLAATDETALAQWLNDNGLVSTPEADQWLAHYVAMDFFYVAMRYDPPKDRTSAKADVAPVEAETVRISFDTPIPYYPYLEPEGPPAGATPSRLLELWYVGRDLVNPIARRETDGEPQWVRPLRPGQRFKEARVALLGALDDEIDQLLPDGELVVQTFRDQKVERAGFDDILFGSYQYRPRSAEEVAALGRYLEILDPQLGKEAR
jgi:hypothetical protein